MTEIVRDRTYHLSPVRLDLDDIQEVVDSMLRGVNNSGVNLVGDLGEKQFEFRDVGHMDTFKASRGTHKLDGLHISLFHVGGSATSSDATIDIRGKSVALATKRPGLQLVGALSDTREILDGKQRWEHKYGFLLPLIPWIVGLFMAWPFYYSQFWFLFFFGGFVVLMTMRIIRDGISCVIVLSRRTGEPFLKKNRDLLIALASSFVTAVVTAVVTWLLLR